MTFPAGLFGHLKAVFGNAYVVFKPTRGEVVRMPESVARLGHVLADELRRRVAIVADGYVAMTGLQPSAVLLVHDVTVRAGRRIVCHVRISFRVNKRVGSDTDGKSQRHAEDNSLSKVKSPHDTIIRSRAHELLDFEHDLTSAMPHSVARGSSQSNRKRIDSVHCRANLSMPLRV